MKKWVIPIVVTCLISSVPTGCVQHEAPVETAQAARGDLIITAPVEEGHLEMRNKEYLSFGTIGEVAEIMVEKGDKVVKDQVLAKLDARPLELNVEMAEARYEMTQNSLRQTIYPHYTYTYGTDLPGVWLALEEIQDNLEEAQTLLEQGEIDEAQALLKLVERDTSKAQEKSLARVWSLPLSVKLAELQADEARAALDLAKLELDKVTITAPFDGVIADVYLHAGQHLSAVTHTTPAIYLVDPSEMEMNGDIDELDISGVSEGQEAIITPDALPHKQLTGNVSFVSPTGKVWEDEVSYETIITLENASEELRDGMSASAEIITDQRHNVLLIPNRAIQGSPENPWVEVVTNNETKKISVALGLSDGMYTEVLSGLEEGEEVVLLKST
jgi:HlyD family secretion protein